MVVLRPVGWPGVHQRRRRRRRRTRRRLNHLFYVDPPECFHRDFASAWKSASDVTDASAQNNNLDARVNAAPLVETGPQNKERRRTRNLNTLGGSGEYSGPILSLAHTEVFIHMIKIWKFRWVITVPTISTDLTLAGAGQFSNLTGSCSIVLLISIV